MIEIEIIDVGIDIRISLVAQAKGKIVIFRLFVAECCYVRVVSTIEVCIKRFDLLLSHCEFFRASKAPFSLTMLEKMCD
ncbi:MAG: hypothetical protein CFE42_11910 [Ralstonia sp. PBBBR1]|nr:MAG: hypothetical protein CFE42_11910 [Ralstonia sp. PBBBR1]